MEFKMNVFRELGASVAGAKAYPDFLKNKKGHIFLYALLLSFIVFVTSFLYISIAFISAGGFSGLVDKYIPDFYFSNGRLSVDKEISFEEGDAYIKVDTDKSFVIDTKDPETIKIINRNSSVIICSSEEIFVKTQGQIETLDFSELGNGTFSRNDLRSYTGSLNTFLIIIYILVFVCMIGGFFLMVLFITLIGMIISAATGANLKFKHIFVLALYARTLPLLLRSLLNLFAPVLPVAIPYQTFIGILITVVYLFFAIKNVAAYNKQFQYNQNYYNGWNVRNNTGYPNGQNGYNYNPDAAGREENSNLTPNDGWSFGNAGTDANKQNVGQDEKNNG